MQSCLAPVLSLSEGKINIKGTRPEGLGALGRREGVGCQAVVLLGRRGEMLRLRARLRRSAR